MPFKIKVEGDANLLKGFQIIGAELRDKALDEALTEASEIIVAEARRLAPKETGLLRRSISRLLRGGSRASYVVIGPLRRISGPGPDGRKRVPANYAHLVEFGHIKVSPKKGTSIRQNTAAQLGFVPPKPFLRPAIENTKAAVRNAMIAALSRFHAKHGKAA